MVITLGNFSSKLLLRTDTGITKLRGRAYEWWGRFLVPTFHPAAALRGSSRVLAEMRADFQLVDDVVSGRLRYEAPAADTQGDDTLGEETGAEEAGVATAGVDRPEPAVTQLGLFS